MSKSSLQKLMSCLLGLTIWKIADDRFVCIYNCRKEEGTAEQ
jgi:hypothetical protein